SAFELSFRLGDADLEIARVELEQELALFDGPVVLHINVDHGPQDARRNQRHGPIDISIIGGNVGDEIPVEVQRGNDPRYDNGNCQHQHGPAEKLRTHFLSGDQGNLGFEETNHPFKWSRPAKYAERRGLSIDRAGRPVSAAEGAARKRLGLLDNDEGTSAGGRDHVGSPDSAGHRDGKNAAVLGLFKLSAYRSLA